MTKIFVRKPKVVPMTAGNTQVVPLMVKDDHILPMMAEDNNVEVCIEEGSLSSDDIPF